MQWRNVMWVYCVEGTNRRWRWLIRAKPEGFPRWWSALYTSTWSMPWTPSSHTQHSHVHTQRDREWVSHTHKKINRFFFFVGFNEDKHTKAKKYIYEEFCARSYNRSVCLRHSSDCYYRLHSFCSVGRLPISAVAVLLPLYARYIFRFFFLFCLPVIPRALKCISVSRRWFYGYLRFVNEEW